MKTLGTILVIGLFALAVPSQAHAVGLPFGGLITISKPCACSGGYLLTVVGPVTKGTFVVQLGKSIPFLYGSFYKPGAFILGNYIPGGVCLVPGDPCVSLPVTGGTITIFGTSL